MLCAVGEYFFVGAATGMMVCVSWWLLRGGLFKGKVWQLFFYLQADERREETQKTSA